MSTNRNFIQDSIVYLLNEEGQTAAVAGYISKKKNVLIPRSINSKSKEYFVNTIMENSLCRGGFKSIEFPEDSKLQTIEPCSLYGNSIETITFPPELIDLKDFWCIGLGSIYSVSVSPLNKKYCSYNNNEMILGKSNIDSDFYDSLVFCVGYITAIQIPDFINHISSCAFSSSQITSITIPSSIVIIDKGAFFENQNLIEVNFAEDSKLQIIEIQAFYGTSIKSIKIPASVIHMKRACFGNCRQLQQIEFAEDSKLKTIEPVAFTSVPIESITIPSEVTELKECWRAGMRKLKRISVSPLNKCYRSIEDKVIIGKTDIESNDYDCLMACIVNNDTFDIPDYIKRICGYSLSDTLIESITIPFEVTSIGKGAFANCFQLKHVNFVNNSKLQKIESRAFCGTLIESITIPSEVTELEEEWCYETKCLNEINVSPLNKRYRSVDNKIIIGKTNIKSNDYDCLVFCARKAKVLTIPDYIKHICACAFANTNINCITIPSEVTTIGRNAFCRSQLQRIDFLNNSKLQKIEEASFAQTQIEKIEIPSEVTVIEICAFSMCKRLRTVTFLKESKLQKINEQAFEMTPISSISIPSSFTGFTRNRFNSLDNLQIIEICENSKLESIYTFIGNYKNDVILMIPVDVTDRLIF